MKDTDRMLWEAQYIKDESDNLNYAAGVFFSGNVFDKWLECCDKRLELLWEAIKLECKARELKDEQ